MIKVKLAKKTHPDFDNERTKKLLSILERGKSEWNRWRMENPNEYIDLREVSLLNKGISLQGMNLSEANLSRANFAKVDFRDADLSAVYAMDAWFQGAYFQNAILRGSYLPQCDFSLAYLTGADLRLTDLGNSNLFFAYCNEANFRKSDLSSANLTDCDFTSSILAQANLGECMLRGSDFSHANLTKCNLSDAVLRESNFSYANLAESNLNGASLVEANLQGANLNGCRVFGTSIWKSNLQDTQQSNLIITPENEAEITVDNIKVAQFIYLLLNNNEVRDVIDTITSKVVLIIGRFTPERKQILDAIRDELRNWDYSPIMFDFDRPLSRNYIETVKTLAGMSRFVIADVTDAKVVLQEIDNILKEFPAVPIQPLLLKGHEPPIVLLDFTDFPAFLELYQYSDKGDLLSNIYGKVITPAEIKAEEIKERRKKAEMMLLELKEDH